MRQHPSAGAFPSGAIQFQHLVLKAACATSTTLEMAGLVTKCKGERRGQRCGYSDHACGHKTFSEMN